MPRPYSTDPKTELLNRALELTEYQSKSFVTVASRSMYSTAAPTKMREQADLGVGGLPGIVGVEIDVAVGTASCVLVLSDVSLVGVEIGTIPAGAVVIDVPYTNAGAPNQQRIVTWPTAINRRYCGIVAKESVANTASQYVTARLLLNTDFDGVSDTWFGMVEVEDTLP